MTKKYALLIYLAAILTTAHSMSASAENVVVEVGDTLIEVPVPKGFRDLRGGASADSYELLSSNLAAPGNRLLAIFITDDDYQRLTDGLELKFARSANLQVLAEGENEFISAQQFVASAAELASQQDALVGKVSALLAEHMPKVSDFLEDEAGVAVAAQITDLVPLGIFFDRVNAMGFAHLFRTQFTIDNQSTDEMMVNAASFMRVRNKLIYGNIGGVYNSATDLEWAKQMAESWTLQILSANQ